MKLQTPSDLARLVKNARAQLGLTQQEVADAVGITRQSLARLERGNGGTSFDTVLIILDRLDIRLEATTDRCTHATTALTTTNTAQAAAAMLDKRITSLIPSDAVEALKKQILGSLPEIDAYNIPKVDTSRLLEHIQTNLDSAALASIREASRELTRSITIPGSVLTETPRAVEDRVEPATLPLPITTTDSDAAGGTE